MSSSTSITILSTILSIVKLLTAVQICQWYLPDAHIVKVKTPTITGGTTAGASTGTSSGATSGQLHLPHMLVSSCKYINMADNIEYNLCCYTGDISPFCQPLSAKPGTSDMLTVPSFEQYVSSSPQQTMCFVVPEKKLCYWLTSESGISGAPTTQEPGQSNTGCIDISGGPNGPYYQKCCKTNENGSLACGTQQSSAHSDSAPPKSSQIPYKDFYTHTGQFYTGGIYCTVVL